MIMKIDFKQPKYIVPLIILPFLPLLFWLYSQNASAKTKVKPDQAGMQDQIGTASSDVQKKAFDNNLQAYSDQWKEADEMIAIGTVEDNVGADSSGPYDAYRLDSIDRSMKQRFGGGALPYAGGVDADPKRMSVEDQRLKAAFAYRPVQGFLRGTRCWKGLSSAAGLTGA